VGRYEVETWVPDCETRVAVSRAFFYTGVKQQILRADLSSADTVKLLVGYKASLAAGDIPDDLAAIMDNSIGRGRACRKFPADRDAWIARHGSKAPYPWGGPRSGESGAE
jgi:hypothetical protein